MEPKLFKKKINNSYLLAEEKLENLQFVNEVVTEIVTSAGRPGFISTVKYNDEERTLFLDGGLRGALKQAKILNKEGTMVKTDIIFDIVPVGKKKVEDVELFMYDIFA